VSGFEGLLTVQDHDTVIGQLRHRRDALPQRVELRKVEAERVALSSERANAVAARDEVAARQAALEADIATGEKRVAEIDKRLYSGDITASRDLQAMSAEIESIKHRVSGLEDAALEVMEELEPLSDAVVALDERGAELGAEAERLRAEIAAAESAIDAELAAEEQVRTEAASGIDEGLLATYEKLRGRLDGIGAARLEHGTCMGCRMILPATELDQIKRQPPDALVFCEQCGRILVR